MALVQITENTLRAFLTDAEITAFDSAGSEGDSPERTGALIRTTCNLVAGIVNASGKYPVLKTGQGKVPEELEYPTLVWIRHAMLADLRIGGRDKIDSMSKGTQEKMQLCLTMSRAARLYLLDEPLGGVDPAARDYILSTILHNYSEDAALMLSTHLIGDIEKVLDEVILLQDGKVLRQAAVDELREETGESVDAYFREVYKC